MATNWKPWAIVGGSAAIAAGAGIYLVRSSLAATPSPNGTPEGGTAGSGSPGGNVGAGGDPPPLNSEKWGNVPVQIQKLLTDVQAAANFPFLWVIGSIVAQGEAGFNPNAHNNDAKERDGSADGLAAGLKRGNPKPKFATAIGDFGSGGLFGALSPYFHWIGLDDGWMPFLNRKPEIVFNPQASGVFMAHYLYRITSPDYVKNRRMDFFDVRVGWASPSVLKNDPFGKTAQGTRQRMRDSIKAIGWTDEWVASLPIARDGYRGIKAVGTAFGFSPDQKD